MKQLLSSILDIPEIRKAASALERGSTPLAIGGLNSVHKAHIAAALAFASGRPLFLLCADDLEAERLCSDTAELLGTSARVLTPREFTFHRADTVSREWENRRVSILAQMRRAGREDGACVFAASYEAATARTIPPEKFDSLALELRPGMSVTLDSLTDALISAGYKRSAQVEGAGQFSVRGGILDFFSPGSDSPVRIELWGDEVDTVSAFDPSTQRRTVSLDHVELLPAAETLPFLAPGGYAGLAEQLRTLSQQPGTSDALRSTMLADADMFENGMTFPAADRWSDLIYPEQCCALDYLPSDTLIAFIDHARSGERAKNLGWQSGEDFRALSESGLIHPKYAEFYLDINKLYKALDKFPFVYLDSFIGAAYPTAPVLLETVSAKQLPSYGGNLETAVEDVKHYADGGIAVVLFSANEARARKLGEILLDRGVKYSLDYGLEHLPEPGQVCIALGSLSAGFEYPALSLAVITEGQLTAPQRPRGKHAKRGGRNRVRSYTDLTPGDYVVHEHHGIGRFSGIVKMEVDGVSRDYIKIAYLGADNLYVPVTQLDLVSKYIGNGGEDSNVRLNKLGGAEWKKQKSRAKAAAKELAHELIELYAARRRTPGFAFAEDDDIQRDFESRFEYTETGDQLSAAADIKRDMQSSFPMDRLLCGDVGFGKTEVALRAVMKCVLSGKQAAILVPTTVLAQQHFLTATRRFAGFPVSVDVLSRFRTPLQQKKTLNALKTGMCDVIIGTHRLIQKDVIFKDLGLLIIDEEQRFGVTHKEKLKEISKSVDVLTLSATPIPRTLNMALSGIRDMSSLEEAPRDRHPVQTYVLEQDEGVILDAIRREIARGGQVYYLYNRVETIDARAMHLAEKLDGISVAVAHGQMHEGELASVMSRLEDGSIQVLVCTTIIETGIDVPNVNTLIVEDADYYGLAQLHQLRGRVGRSQRRAYAYLCFKRGKVLSEIAEKRLSAIREFAEFGAGFKIAMRDLEIRGAGNVLGHAQSGHMMNVGYDMYLKLLEEAVVEEQGGDTAVLTDCTADILVSAGIPENYVADAGQRMDLYRRIALVRTEEDASDLIDELCDRYGDMPSSVYTLIRIARLRAEAAAVQVSDISQKSNRILFSLARPDIRAISALCGERRWRGRLFFSAGEKPALTLKLEGASPLDEAEAIISGLGTFAGGADE